MKRILAIVILAMAAPSLIFSQTAAQKAAPGNKAAATTNSKAEQEVLKVLDEVLAALVKRDAAVIERVFTDDYYTVYDGGQVGDRARVLNSFKSTTSGWDVWDRAETTVKLHGNTAIVLSQNKVKGHNSRGSFDANWRVTTVWVKERGQWRLAASQFTSIKPPAPPAQ